jgi:protein-serine/threonine kinase
LKEERRGPSSFEKIRLIGKGGVGRVYLVRLKDTNELFAMKVLKKSEMIQRNKVQLTPTLSFVLFGYLPRFSTCVNFSSRSGNLDLLHVAYSIGIEMPSPKFRCLPVTFDFAFSLTEPVSINIFRICTPISLYQ